MANPQPASKIKGLFETSFATPPLPVRAETAAPHESPEDGRSEVKAQGAPSLLWGWYKRCLGFLWRIVTATWYAVKVIAGDWLHRSESDRLKGELAKQQAALGEKMLQSELRGFPDSTADSGKRSIHSESYGVQGVYKGSGRREAGAGHETGDGCYGASNASRRSEGCADRSRGTGEAQTRGRYAHCDPPTRGQEAGMDWRMRCAEWAFLSQRLRTNIRMAPRSFPFARNKSRVRQCNVFTRSAVGGCYPARDSP